MDIKHERIEKQAGHCYYLDPAYQLLDPGLNIVVQTLEPDSKWEQGTEMWLNDEIRNMTIVLHSVLRGREEGGSVVDVVRFVAPAYLKAVLKIVTASNVPDARGGKTKTIEVKAVSEIGKDEDLGDSSKWTRLQGVSRAHVVVEVTDPATAKVKKVDIGHVDFLGGFARHPGGRS